MLPLLVFSVTGLILWRWQERRAGQAGLAVPENHATFHWPRWLAALLLAWAALHLALVLIEVIGQPLFPWDAWLLWAYRAKTWFYTGLAPHFVSNSEWLINAAPQVYTVDANSYPMFASAMPLWAAIALGHWS